jgi:hypothetical protein
MFQRIWQENRRFILQVGGGLAIFLILKSCVVEGFIGRGAASLRSTNQTVEAQVNKLRNEVVARAPEEKKNLEELEAIEKDLAGAFQTPRPTDVPTAKGGSAQTQFTVRIEKLWGEVLTKARQRNVKIPEKITADDLKVSGPDSDLEMSAAYLEILGRALKACVDLGMVQIDRPAIYLPDAEGPIPGADPAKAVYRRVGLTVHGPYEAFRRILGEFQNPGFIQVRLVSLDGKSTVGPGLVRGQLDFVGFFIDRSEEVGESPADGGAAAEPKPKAPRKGSSKSGIRRKGP